MSVCHVSVIPIISNYIDDEERSNSNSVTFLTLFKDWAFKDNTCSEFSFELKCVAKSELCKTLKFKLFIWKKKKKIVT